MNAAALQSEPLPSVASAVPRAALRIVKVCSCRREYDRAGWDALPPVGVQDDGWILATLKNCPSCNSTLAVVTGLSPSLTGHPTEEINEMIGELAAELRGHEQARRWNAAEDVNDELTILTQAMTTWGHR